MKKNYWLIFGAMLSTHLLAQQVTNPPASTTLTNLPAVPVASDAAAPAKTNAPAATAKKKKAAKKKAEKTVKKDAASELRTVPLVAGPAVVIASNVNVRGQAKLKSEVLTRLAKGQPVTVIEEVTLKKSGPDEPSAWAKITLPPAAHAWVNTTFLDPTNKTVLPGKLKLRGGPGEAYSVLGMLKRGDAVKEVSAKGDWTEIEPPAEAYAFVAAQYLKQEAPGVVAATPVEPAPVTEAPAVAAAPTEAPAAPAAPIATPAATNAAAASAAEEPPPRRIVQREGIVRGTFSIQAPTQFELISPDTGKAVNYLYTTSSSLDLKRYKGLRIVVTGEEALDERWPNTPVITIQRIQVVE